MYAAWFEPIALGFSCATATGMCGYNQHCKAYLGPRSMTLSDQQYSCAQDCVQFPDRMSLWEYEFCSVRDICTTTILKE